jgi:hypothetical protein
VRREDVEPRMEDGENEMVESKRNQPQINADEEDGIPDNFTNLFNSSASIGVICG